MKRFLKKIVLFLFFTWLLSWGVYGVLFLFERTYYSKSLKTRWTLGLKGKQVDYLFLGSSRMANTIACAQLDSALHSHSLNIATQGSSYGENYVLLYEFLRNGNTAHTLVLSLDLFRANHKNYEREAITPLVFKQFDLFPVYQQAEVRKVYTDHSKAYQLYLWDYLPFSRYAEFNTYFKTDDLYRYFAEGKQQSPAFDPISGEQLIYRFDFKGDTRASPGVITLGPRGETYLLKILTLAQKHHMNIVLLTAPYYDVRPFDRRFHQSYVDSLTHHFQARYMDLSGLPAWKDKQYFADGIHTNASGSRLMTRYLSDSLACLVWE